jgi:hypothetical protein
MLLVRNSGLEPGTKFPWQVWMMHLARRSQTVSRVASGVLRSGRLPVAAEACCHERRRFYCRGALDSFNFQDIRTIQTRTSRPFCAQLVALTFGMAVAVGHGRWKLNARRLAMKCRNNHVLAIAAVGACDRQRSLLLSRLSITALPHSATSATSFDTRQPWSGARQPNCVLG